MASRDIQKQLAEYLEAYNYIVSMEEEIQGKLDKYRTRTDYEMINAQLLIALSKLKNKVNAQEHLVRFMHGAR